MNKLRRFIIGALFISSVVTLSVIPGFAFAFAPSSPVIEPSGSTTNGAISFIADTASFVTGYTADGTNPEVSCISQQCNAVGTTQIFSGEYGSTWILGADGDLLTIKAASFDDQGQGSPVMVRNYIFDKEAPVVSGFTDGASYDRPVTINISDASWIEVFVNGQYHTSNTINIALDGNYELYAYDAFMQSTPIYHFTIDQTAPDLELNGGDDITVEARAPFNDPGITINDASGIVRTWTEGNLNTGIVGTYTVKYYAEDALGNVSSITRTIRVVDTTAPVITLNGSNNVTLEVHSTYIELGATALDSYDGNLTPNIVISGSVNTHRVGVYTITYRVTDAHGNTSTVTRTVSIVDTTAPVLTLNGNTNITLEVHNPYVEAGYTAIDNYDGDITSNVVVSGTVNWHVVGTYVLTYTTTDARGNVTALTRTIHIVDTTKPVITLNGSGTITLEVHSPYVELGATSIDNYDGDITSRIVVTGSVDVHTVGVYTLTYTITDANGNVSVITRTIRIVDTTKPVITLIGNSEIVIYVGDSYSEQGVKADDNYDGNISYKVVTSGSIDTSVAGVYTLVYAVTDANGNTAYVVRTVRVLVRPVVPTQMTSSNSDASGTSDEAVSSTSTDTDELGTVNGTDDNGSASDSEVRKDKSTRFVWSNLDTILAIIALIIFSILSLGYYKNRKQK